MTCHIRANGIWLSFERPLPLWQNIFTLVGREERFYCSINMTCSFTDVYNGNWANDQVLQFSRLKSAKQFIRTAEHGRSRTPEKNIAIIVKYSSKWNRMQMFIRIFAAISVIGYILPNTLSYFTFKYFLVSAIRILLKWKRKEISTGSRLQRVRLQQAPACTINFLWIFLFVVI